MRVCVCVLNSACGDVRAFLTARACFSFCANVDLRGLVPRPLFPQLRMDYITATWKEGLALGSDLF